MRASAPYDTSRPAASTSPHRPDPRRPRRRRRILAAGLLVVTLAIVVAIVAIVNACAPSSVLICADTQAIDSAQEVVVTDTQTSAAVHGTGGLSLGTDDVLTVVLDPGHGDSDEGASGYGLLESDITWSIAQYCAAYLEQCDDVQVVLTRDQFQNVSLENRALVAVAAEADILVSLHINFNDEDARLSGFYVYYPNAISTWAPETCIVGEQVATTIASNLAALGLVDNGIWEAPLDLRSPEVEDAEHYTYPDDASGVSDYYGIIRWPRMNGIAAVLVEHAFLSNASDAALLGSESFLKALGEADARAILEAYGFEVSA